MTRTYVGNAQNNVKTATKTLGLFWEKWNMYGLAGNDVLTGGQKDDLINGGSGIDRMAGRKGNDRYIVDNIYDTTIERAGEGIDTVEASVSYSLAQNVENIKLTGSAAINGYGNELDNDMFGNNNNNTLMGRAGRDEIRAYGGHDRLDGGTGADTLVGGSGNDVYVVDDAGDIVSELPGWTQGYDTVETLRNHYALPDNVEALKLRSSSAVVYGYGNSGNNSITGNVSNNVLSGRDGNDFIQGYLGSDRLIGGDGNDHLVGMHISTNNERDILNGGADADVFRLYNFVGNNGYTYNNSGYATIEDFSAFEQDKIWVLGSQSEYSLTTTDFIPGGSLDTMIYKGSNLVGVAANATNLDLARDFTFVAG